MQEATRQMARRLVESLRGLLVRRAVRLALLTIFVVTFLVFSFLFLGYRRDRARLTTEWAAKAVSEERRSPAVIRGLLEGLIAHPEEVPILPQSMVDNPACAAAVCQLTNFLVGGREPVLQTADAWRFAHVNRHRLERIYDRLRTYPSDFAREDDRIVERYDRRITLSHILRTVGRGDTLTMDGLYVVGYHYHDTQSDRVILNAPDATWNSHLLLIAGRRNGRWWGYHLYHDPARPNANPFQIADLGEELPPQFDLMYVWRVRGISLGLERAPVRLFSPTRPFRSIRRLVGWANWTRSDRFASLVDSGMIGWFGDEEQYPVILSTEHPYAAVTSPNLRRRWQGQVTGFLSGISIRRQVGPSQRNTYGLEFQCVEFVNRYYSTVLAHRNMTRSGNADSYFYDARGKELVSFPNGGETAPQLHDIIVFDPDGSGQRPGHVGIVYEVTRERVCLAQQNMPEPSVCLPVQVRDGRWSVSSVQPDLPCVGWSRQREVSHGPSSRPRYPVPGALARSHRGRRWR